MVRSCAKRFEADEGKRCRQVFLEMFVAPEFQEISLNRWLRALPQQAAMAHTNLKKDDLERIPTDGNPVIR
jgi:oxalate decarboxylase